MGIPAALCFYTMFKLNGTVKELTDAVNAFKDETKKINEKQTEKIEKIEHDVLELKYRLGADPK